MIALRSLLLSVSIASLIACSPTEQVKGRIDGEKLVKDLQTLAADDMEGRKPGTPGHEKARAMIVKRFEESGIKPYDGKFVHSATVRGQQAHNIIGTIKGTTFSGFKIAITAHYDHIGRQGERIFNGSDDNASGVCALFQLAAYFAKHQPKYTLIFAALDCEEIGMQGATAFLDLIPAGSIALNVNLDMISRDTEGKLYAVGTRSYPFLKPYLEKLPAHPPVKLLFGFDGSNPRQDDWTTQSDHIAFHRRGIPFVYFGDENEENHHRHTDDPSTMIKDFYIGSVETILDAILAFDADLPAIVRATPKKINP